jgi:hypothetical protein
VEFLPEMFGGDKGEVNILGNVVVPKQMRDRHKELAVSYSNIFDLQTPEGRSQALRNAERDLKLEGWAPDSDALQGEIAKTMFGLSAFEPFSDDFITTRPSAIWRQDSLRSVIDDEEVIQASYREAEKFVKNSTSWKEYTKGAKRTPKVGVNMQLSNAGRFTREDGNEEFGFVAWVQDGNGFFHPIQDEVNLNNHKIFFFGLTQQQIQEKRDRVFQEARSEATKHSERRAKRQEEERLRREFGMVEPGFIQ